MSKTISIEDAAARLADLISDLHPGEEIKLTAQNRPVARLIPEPLPSRPARRGFGACKGMITILKEDDEHLADFKEYME